MNCLKVDKLYIKKFLLIMNIYLNINIVDIIQRTIDVVDSTIFNELLLVLVSDVALLGGLVLTRTIGSRDGLVVVDGDTFTGVGRLVGACCVVGPCGVTPVVGSNGSLSIVGLPKDGGSRNVAGDCVGTRFNRDDGAQDACVFVSSKHRHDGITRPLLSRLVYIHSPLPKQPSGQVNNVGQTAARRGHINVALSVRLLDTTSSCPSYSQICSILSCAILTTRSFVSHIIRIHAGRYIRPFVESLYAFKQRLVGPTVSPS